MKHHGNGNQHSDLSLQHYTNLYPSYFDGPTGERIARYGGIQALSLGTYLLANRFATSIGLYYLPVEAMRLPLTIPEIASGLDALDRATFAEYDYGTSFVWVREMARIRMGVLNRNECLKPSDNRSKHINKLYCSLPDNPFLCQFYRRYRKQFSIIWERRSALIRRNFDTFASKGIPKGIRDPLLKPVVQIVQKSTSTN
jgi:hypothetical protein